MKTRYLLLTIFVIFGLAVLSYRMTYALFADSATSTGNTFTAASEFPPVTSAALKINEFLPSPSEGLEWVEIFNGTNFTVDLTGWKITDGNAINDDLSLSGIITPNSFLTFDHSSGWLNTDGDTVNLINAASEIVDTEIYSAVLEATDASIGRQPDGTGVFKRCDIITKGLTNIGC